MASSRCLAPRSEPTTGAVQPSGRRARGGFGELVGDLLAEHPRSITKVEGRLSGTVEELRRWGWVMGRERLELTGIGIYHAGPTKRGLLG